MTTWFTSDQHFGHGRLLELSPARGAAFATISEMSARLVHNWNAVVQPEDTVWVLGDVDMHGKDLTLALIEQLVGTKILVSGNPLLHGHAHEAFRERRTAKGTWGINVGVDWWNYAPVSAETFALHLEDLRRDRIEPISG